MKKYIFRAETPYANLVKVVAEVLQTNLKTSCFQLKRDGIYLRQMDDNRLALVDLKLDASKFELFEFNTDGLRGESSLFIGLTLTHLHKLLRTVKKKDKLALYILTDVPNEIAIEIKPKDANRVSTSFLKIQRVQNILVDIPKGYNYDPVVIPSSEFQKIYKDILCIGKNVKIKTYGGKVQFDVDAGNIVKRRVEYGDIDTQDEIRYDETFGNQQISRLCKISNLHSNVSIFTERQLPFLIKSNVGEIGSISIFIKSQSQIVSTQ